MKPHDAGSQAGFSLIEALATLAVTASIISGLALIAGQWLPNWRHGFTNLQRADLLAVALDRVAADLSAAQATTLNAASRGPLFIGSPEAVVFVRASANASERSRLEVVRLAETPQSDGLDLVRDRAAFAPLTQSVFKFADPVILARAPFRLSFAYSGPDRLWVDVWRDMPQLPRAVRVTVRDATTGLVLGASTAVALKAQSAPKSAAGAGKPPAPQDQPKAVQQ